MKTQPIKGFQWVQREKQLKKEWATFCCGDRLRPCQKCQKDTWKSRGDTDCGDWEEESFQYQSCGNIIYVELPD